MVAPGVSDAGAGIPFREGAPMLSRLKLSFNWILPLPFQLISFVSSLVVLNLTLSLGVEGGDFREPSERDIPTHVRTEGSSLLLGKPPCLPEILRPQKGYSLRGSCTASSSPGAFAPSPLSSGTCSMSFLTAPTPQKLPLF